MTSRLFLDTELTGLRQDAGLVSLALCAEDDQGFYAEISDLERSSCDPWVLEHVIPQTRWLSRPDAVPEVCVEGALRLCFGNPATVARELRAWLAQWRRIQVWGDCLAYDWVVFCELFGGARRLPANIHYIPFDLATLFESRGLDPDTDRFAFARLYADRAQRHHALWDALAIRGCHRRLL